MNDVTHTASKAGGKLGQYAPLIIAGILVLAAIYVYSRSSGSSGYQIVGATNNSAERSAANAANASATQAHDTNILAGFSTLTGLATTQYNDQTQIALGDQKLQDQIAQYQAAQTIATLQQQSSIAQSNAARDVGQAQAHAAQQASVWGSISSIFGSAEKAFAAQYG